jgi:uncharacterized CHY-type Zn-finger protein
MGFTLFVGDKCAKIILFLRAESFFTWAKMHENTVLGLHLDAETRCQHYQSEVDRIAIKMYCCKTYYACYSCHESLANHPAQAWPREEWDELAILCGHCKSEMTIQEYLQCQNSCKVCGAAFNPNCAIHYPLYFQV